MRLVIPAILLFGLSCATPVKRSSAEPASSASPVASATTPSASASTSAPRPDLHLAPIASGVLSLPPPKLDVAEVEGVTTTQLHSLLTPLAANLQQCAPVAGGKIKFRIARVEGALKVVVLPGGSLNVGEDGARCVLSALTPLKLEDTGSNVGGPRVPVSGFTSLVTVSW